jgi:hypothetical protein
MRQRAERLFYWHTEAALEDEVLRELLSYVECEILKDEVGHDHILIFHPYINQAEGLLYTINIKNPLPEFTIWESNIPYDLALELERLGQIKMKGGGGGGVRRIYETVDPEYYHTNGIHGKVKWRFGED